MIEKNKVIASIQVRTGSTRLPGKVLKKICGKPMLLLMLERLSKCKLLDEIIISTTVNKNDDPIVELAKNHGYKIFRGDEYDCLDRHYQAVKNSNANIMSYVWEPDTDKYTPNTSSKFNITSQENLLLLFPAYLNHYVRPNMNKEERISLSFNIK